MKNWNSTRSLLEYGPKRNYRASAGLLDGKRDADLSEINPFPPRTHLMRRIPGPLFHSVLLAWAGLACAAAPPPHWSFQPLQKPAPPQVAGISWVRNPIDRFILAPLEARDLQPVAEADRLTLLRRLTTDLTGLPPTIAEIDTFLADDSTDAYEHLVDRLLASPHYGERWGRHWLDVARYVQGRTKVAGVDRTDLAEPYRDYVVRSLNADKPYDRFVTEQLAGDLLPEPDDRRAGLDQAVAPAFLSIGPWFADCADPNSLRMDVINEQISTVSQAFLGLDFGCARCHDHKFDPVPTRDYYALAGIFGSTRVIETMNENWRDGRMRLTRPLATPEQLAATEVVRRTIGGLRGDRWRALQEARESWLAEISPHRAAYREALSTVPPPTVIRFEAEDYHGQNNVRRVTIEGVGLVETQRAREQWVQYRPIVPEAGRYLVQIRCAAPAPLRVELKLDGKPVLPDKLLPATGGWEPRHLRWVTLGTFPFRTGSNDVRLWAKENAKLPRLDQIRFVLEGPARESALDNLATQRHLDRNVLTELAVNPAGWPPNVADAERFVTAPALEALDARIAEWEDKLPQLETVLAVEDYPQPVNEPVHAAGDVYEMPGDPVPRGVPSIAADFMERPRIPESASGRLQLAQWITDPHNPLTARVIANRLWLGHFGRGLVDTPGDFGIQGMPPSNRDLLDWLAATLIEENWSLKALHRRIVTSATYRLGGETDPRSAATDPDNRLHWRYPRHRLEVEAIYDGMLTSIGKVPRQPAGQPLDTSRSKDRALYILTSSRSPLGMGIEIRKMLSLFGCDPSGVPVHRRDHSTSAAQSLFWLNNKLPKYYAGKLAARLLALPGLDDPARATMAFRLTVTRPPDRETLTRSLAYLHSCRHDQGLGETEAWSRLCLAIFSSDAFSYLE